MEHCGKCGKRGTAGIWGGGGWEGLGEWGNMLCVCICIFPQCLGYILQDLCDTPLPQSNIIHFLSISLLLVQPGICADAFSLSLLQRGMYTLQVGVYTVDVCL